MVRGLHLGLMDTMRQVASEQQSPSERYNDDAFFQAMLKECRSKFPAMNLYGQAIVSPRYISKTAFKSSQASNLLHSPNAKAL